MREKLKARDPQFKKWSDLNDRIEELKREQIHRLHDYLLRHTEHPNLLGDGRNRGELEEVAHANLILRGDRYKNSNCKRTAESNEHEDVRDHDGEPVLFLAPASVMAATE